MVVCIASGPSLTPADLEAARRAHAAGRCRAIVVNRSWEKAPWADLLYGADAKFWHRAGGAPGFKGLKLCCATVATHVAVRDGQRWRIVEHHEGVEYRDVRSIRYSLEEGLSADPAVLASGGNSGYQAAGLAAHLTGTGIVALLGYDMKPGPGGALHHHPDHPDHNPTPAQMAGWAKAFEGMARDLGKFPGLRIVNCTPDSAIDAFPRAALEDLL